MVGPQIPQVELLAVKLRPPFEAIGQHTLVSGETKVLIRLRDTETLTHVPLGPIIMLVAGTKVEG